MTLEIKTKCSECGSDLDWYHEVSVSELMCCVKPCPTCHPPKPDKVTPKEGDMIEVRNPDWSNGIFDTRKATGVRSTLQGFQVWGTHGSTFYRHQWRYPGEKEWRD